MTRYQTRAAGSEYNQGRSYYQTGMPMSASERCPYKIGAGDARTRWLSGFFDAYFQAFCDARNLGRWGA